MGISSQILSNLYSAANGFLLSIVGWYIIQSIKFSDLRLDDNYKASEMTRPRSYPLTSFKFIKLVSNLPGDFPSFGCSDLQTSIRYWKKHEGQAGALLDQDYSNYHVCLL